VIRDLLDEGFSLSAIPHLLSEKKAGTLEERLRALRQASATEG
jgi:DNA-binding transcriptional MerR regulator